MIEVRSSGRGEVVIKYHGAMPDKDGSSTVVLSPPEDMNLAKNLAKAAMQADSELEKQTIQ